MPATLHAYPPAPREPIPASAIEPTIFTAHNELRIAIAGIVLGQFQDFSHEDIQTKIYTAQGAPTIWIPRTEAIRSHTHPMAEAGMLEQRVEDRLRHPHTLYRRRLHAPTTELAIIGHLAAWTIDNPTVPLYWLTSAGQTELSANPYAAHQRYHTMRIISALAHRESRNRAITYDEIAERVNDERVAPSGISMARAIHRLGGVGLLRTRFTGRGATSTAQAEPHRLETVLSLYQGIERMQTSADAAQEYFLRGRTIFTTEQGMRSLIDKADKFQRTGKGTQIQWPLSHQLLQFIGATEEPTFAAIEHHFRNHFGGSRETIRTYIELALKQERIREVFVETSHTRLAAYTYYELTDDAPPSNAM